MKIRLSLGAAALLALLLSSQAQSQECSFSTVADVVFLVDGSSSVGRPNFKYIRNFISAAAGAFQIGEDKTRVGVVQYSGDAQTEFNLNQHFARPALLRAIGSLPYKEGNTMTASAAGKKLTVSDETERSMKVTWTPAPGKVTHYRLKYVPSGGGKEVVQKSPSTSTFMRRLQPMTTYNITVHPIYKRGEGKARQGVGTTHTQCKTTAKADLVLLVDGSWSIGHMNFRTIRNFIGRMVSVFDISPDRVQIGLAQYSGDPKTEWHLNAHPTKESLLEAIASLPYKGGNTRTGLALNYILQNNFRPNVGLRPDSRKIGILITDGKSQDEIILSSQNLRDSGIELYAIGVENADENELRSIASDPDEIHMYNVNKFQFLLDIVDDLTVNLCNSVKGPGGELEAATNLVTSEVTHRSFRATWTAPDSPVDTYRVTYMTVAGGPTQELLVDGSVTTVVLEGLTPLTEYLVNVYSVVGEQSSEPLNGTETTLPLPFAGVLRITDVTHSTMKLNWDAAPGAVLKYIITYKPEEGDLKEVEVGGDITSLDLSSLISQTEYDVAVTPIYNTGPGNPMLGTAITDTQCKTTAKADLVLLVDGSWSIGYMNFRTIRNFIGRMVSVFDISPDRVQIGLAQYSGDPKTEWHLNAHPTKESLLEAIASLPYKGGNTRTGLALNYILQNNFRPNVGLRPDSRKIGILITDGKSQDEIILSSQNLRDSGIELYAIGVENADENELRSIASDPDEIHMYNVNKFQFLLDIVDDLTVNLCNSVKGPGGELKAATNLVTSEVTHRSFRATWTAPDSPVDTYRVTYMTVAGGPTQELLVDGSVTTVVLEGLTPLTEYLVNVYSVVGEQSSEPLNGTETTLPLPFAGVLRITDVTHSTMKLNWDAAPGAVLKYIITYKPEEGDLKEVEVGGDITSLDLSSLISQTEYDVAVTPIYNTGPGNPMLGTAITDVVPAPKNLKFSEVAQTSFRATWEHGAPDVALYRIGWTKRGDTNTQFAILNSDETSHVLQNLDPDTEYSVTVTAIYPDESESEDLMGSHHILTQ